jgi:hypothetical protein
MLWYARLDNLSNQLAYSATSILTTTAYPKAPLPGAASSWACRSPSEVRRGCLTT